MQYMGSGINAFTNTLNALTNIHGQQLQNKMAQLKLNDLPQMLQIAREEAMLKQNMLPQQLQADLDKEKTGTAYTKAQIPYTQAQTDALKQKTAYGPAQFLLDIQKLKQGNQTQKQNALNNLSSFLKAFPTEVREQAITTEKQPLATILHQATQNALQQSGGMQQPAPSSGTDLFSQIMGLIPKPQGQPAMSPQLQAPTQQPATQGIPFAPQAPVAEPQLQQPQVQPQSTQAQQPFDINKAADLLGQVADTARDKKLSTPATWGQMEAATQIDKIIDNPTILKQMENATKFAGLVGKGKAALDAASQKNPEDYEDYLAFMHQTLPLISNRIRTLDKMGVQKESIQDLKGLYKSAFDNYSSNPKQAMTQMNKLFDTLRVISKAVRASAHKTNDTQQTQAPTTQGADIQIPTFSSKDEFNKWYHSQSPERQRQIYARLPE